MGREIPDAVIEVPETKSTSGLFFLPSKEDLVAF